MKDTVRKFTGDSVGDLDGKAYGDANGTYNGDLFVGVTFEVMGQ